MEILLLEKTFYENYMARLSYLVTQPNASASLPKFSESGIKLYEIQDDTAVIYLRGVLGNTRSFYDEIMGTAPTLTYPELIKALDEIESNSKIAKIDFYMDTPGGSMTGLDQAAEVMQLVSKPITVYTSDMLASAGYYLASQADKIVALSESASIGSIGVAWTLPVEGKYAKTITNTKSYAKIPDVGTPEGQTIVKEYLDEAYSLFAKRVMEGRGITEEELDSKYGQGRMFMAKQAYENGMIDGIQTRVVSVYRESVSKVDTDLNAKPPQVAKIKGEKKNMEETKSVDLDAIRAEGAKIERERVSELMQYKTMFADNKEVVALIDESIASGNSVAQIRAKLDLAIYKGGNINGSTLTNVTTQNVDPVAESSANVDDNSLAEAKAKLKAVVKGEIR